MKKKNHPAKRKRAQSEDRRNACFRCQHGEGAARLSEMAAQNNTVKALSGIVTRVGESSFNVLILLAALRLGGYAVN